MDGLLFSDHSRPLDGLWIQDLHPRRSRLLPGLLGIYRREAFVARLEKGRAIPRPWVMGMALSAKPTPNLEWGLHRTALFGGAGQEVDWGQILIGQGENDPASPSPGDQKAGGHIRKRFSWGATRGAAYLEAAGEDSAGGLPSKWAFLGGLHLPSLGGGPWSLRLEAADTRIPGSTGVWYTHNAYQSGYTFHGRPLGAATGTDGRSLRIRLLRSVPSGQWVGDLFRWRSLANAPAPEEGWIGTLGWDTPGASLSLSCSKIQNPAGISAKGEILCSASAGWSF